MSQQLNVISPSCYKCQIVPFLQVDDVVGGVSTFVPALTI